MSNWVYTPSDFDRYNLRYPPFLIYTAIDSNLNRLATRSSYFSFGNEKIDDDDGAITSRVIRISDGCLQFFYFDMFKVVERKFPSKQDLYSILSKTSDDSLRSIIKKLIRGQFA